MSTSHEPAIHAPTNMRDGQTPSATEPVKTNDLRRQFTVMALNMSWQLAIAVLVPIIGGVELDRVLHGTSIWLYIGLFVAAVGATGVMWKTAQVANRLPVPKLTEDQKRAIRKSYEDEDKDE